MRGNALFEINLGMTSDINFGHQFGDNFRHEFGNDLFYFNFRSGLCMCLRIIIYNESEGNKLQVLCRYYSMGQTMCRTTWTYPDYLHGDRIDYRISSVNGTSVEPKDIFFNVNAARNIINLCFFKYIWSPMLCSAA